MQGRTRGFTILELCVTLVLITVTATLSIWAYFSRSEITLVNAAELLVEDLRIAQMRAACNRTPVEVVFDRKANSYHVAGIDDPSLPREGRPRAYAVDAVFEGVRITGDDLGATQTITFNERGQAVRAARITLSFRGDSRTVLVPTGENYAVLADEPHH
ncbi:MAG: GspH/FimT family pseudopilin [Planctomycetes bacterium]|nr:GspH/FimT family pseudopilin [Planctomycetota bacterium]